MSTPNTAAPDFGALLEAHGIPILSRSGREVRIAAAWRGGDGATVSIQTDTGLWYDHKTREGGGWRRLTDADHLALGDGMERPHVDTVAIQERNKKERKTRVQEARNGWDAGDRLDDALLAKLDRAMLSNRKRAAKTRNMDHIKTMRGYFQDRGPGMLEAAIRGGARALRGAHKLNSGQYGQGRPCILFPMRDPVARTIPTCGAQVGIQREWGRGHENKRMKGLHMVARDPAADPSDSTKDKISCAWVIPPSAKTQQSVLFFHEGPTTTCATGSARPDSWAASLFDTAGMANPPRQIAEEAQRKGATALIFVADGDAPGIEAAIKGARVAMTWGLKIPVKISLRPWGWDQADLLMLDGICEEVDGREVVRECLERGMSDVPPPGKKASVWSIQPWRPAEKPVRPAATVPVEDAREIIKRGVREMVLDYTNWLAELDERKEQGNKGRLPLAKPWLFKPTTGTGKTTAIKALINDAALLAAGGSVLALVPTHDQADAYQEDGWWHYYGRNPDPHSRGYCPNYAELMDPLRNHHIAQNEFCHKCPNGLKWADDYKALEKMGFFGEKLANLRECVWQQHLRDTQEQAFVVAPIASFSETLAAWAFDGLGEDKSLRHRLVTVDEHCQMAALVEVGLTDIDLWARRLADNLRFLEAHQVQADAVTKQTGPTPFQSVQESQDERRAEIAATRAVLDLFKVLAGELGRLVGQEGRIGVAPALLDATKQILDVDKDDVTGWERLEFNRDGTLKLTPLRAAWAIRKTLEHGGGFVKDGKLHVAAVRPILDRIGKRPIAFFDATPNPVTMAAVQAHDGHTVQALAVQHAKLIRHPRRWWGLKPFSKNATPEQKKRAIRQYKALRKLHPHKVLLVHKKVRTAIDPDGEDEPLGHWGSDHRAHDRWAGKDIVIVGSFLPPMDTWRATYQAARVAALSAGANLSNWPEWPDSMEMEEGAWITEGTHEVQSYLPLPTDQKIRSWLLETVTAEVVQAIGRCRGANLDPAHPVMIHIYGGVPLCGLGEHGLMVAAYETDDPFLGASRSGNAMDARQAIAAAAAAGQRTFKTIQAWIKARFKIAVGIDRVRSVMRSLEAAARESGDDIEAIYQKVATRADAYLHRAQGDLQAAIGDAVQDGDWLAAELLDIPAQADDGWGPITTDPPTAA